MRISLPEATQPVGRYDITESMTHSRCDARPKVTSQTYSTSTAPWTVLISRPTQGRRLSWPEWLVTYPSVCLQTVTYLSTNTA